MGKESPDAQEESKDDWADNLTALNAAVGNLFKKN